MTLPRIVTAIALSTLSLAEPAFYCIHNDKPELQGFGDLEFYKTCGEICSCSVFELVCLRRGQHNSADFTLESEGFAYADACPATECLCNIVPDWQQWSAPANNDRALPKPNLVGLPTFAELENLALSTEDQTSYFRSLYTEITGLNSQRVRETINHPINEGKPSELPSIVKSPSLNSITDKCTFQVSCDLHYELDWNYRLRKTINCADVASIDPCFATFACICDNGYYQIASNMPAPPQKESEISSKPLGEGETKPEEVDNFVELLPNADEIIQEASAQDSAQSLATTNVTEEEEDSDTLLLIIIIVGASAVLIIIVIVIVCCFIKRKNRKTQNEVKHMGKVNPLPQQTEVTEISDFKDESGMKKKKPISQGQNPVLPTDDERSQVDGIEPPGLKHSLRGGVKNNAVLQDSASQSSLASKPVAPRGDNLRTMDQSDPQLPPINNSAINERSNYGLHQFIDEYSGQNRQGSQLNDSPRQRR